MKKKQQGDERMLKEEGTSGCHMITIPNILTICRIFMIPIFIWLYCCRRNNLLAIGILVLSGATDMLDGWIARRFHMVSPLGKALDPIADKLTQGAVLLCLGSRFPFLLLLAGVLVVKELITGCMSLAAVQRTQQVKGADWHGKVTTVFLYITMLLHLAWGNIPFIVSMLSAGICLVLMTVSFVLYFKRNISMIRHKE